MSPLVRHAVSLAIAAVGVLVFWEARPTWSSEMRLWKAVGDSALVLLLAVLAIGPLARLSTPFRRLLPWRRQLGIWFALTATLHAFLVASGWARWSLRRFLGYEFVPQLGREARLEPGFGLANLLGLSALILALILAATSSDWALRRLGAGPWKWLHRGVDFVFYATLLHAGYYLFLHYTVSFHKAVPPPDWFRMPFVIAGLAVVALRTAAFWRTVNSRAAAPPS